MNSGGLKIKIGLKTKDPSPTQLEFRFEFISHVHLLYDKRNCFRVSQFEFQNAILEFIVRKGTNLALLCLMPQYLNIYDKEGNKVHSINFLQFAHCFNGNIEKSLIY